MSDKVVMQQQPKVRVSRLMSPLQLQHTQPAGGDAAHVPGTFSVRTALPAWMNDPAVEVPICRLVLHIRLRVAHSTNTQPYPWPGMTPVPPIGIMQKCRAVGVHTVSPAGTSGQTGRNTQQHNTMTLFASDLVCLWLYMTSTMQWQGAEHCLQ